MPGSRLLLAAVVLAVALGAAMITPPAEAAPDAGSAAAQLGDFGAPAAPAEGVRPLVTILMHFSDRRFALTHNRGYYRRLLFGEPGRLLGRVAGQGGFFDENSHGRFHYRDAGVLGPFLHPDNPRTPIDESTYACASNGSATCTQVAADVRENAILRALASGFEFAPFDTNGDGRVTTEELTILLVFAEPPTGSRQGGSMMELDCIRVDFGRRVCTESIGVGEGVGAGTIAHELTHTFDDPYGVTHLYGTGFRLNYPYSVFAGTINAGVDDFHAISHLDPYTKMRLGWLAPRVVPVTDSGCLRLRATELSPGATPQAYLLYDPAAGTNEYFLLEHRLPLTFNYDGDPFLSGTTLLRDQGLAVWYARTSASGALLTVQPFDIPAGGSDPSLYLLPSRGTMGQARQLSGGLWDAEDGAVPLQELDLTGVWPTWQPYHREVGLRVSSPSVRQAEIEILLNRTRSCAKPRRLPPIARGSMPEAGEPPCTQRSLQLRCIFRTPFFTLVRRLPAHLPAGTTSTVRWTVIPRRDLPAGLTVTDRLPSGFRVPGRRPVVRFPALRRGKALTRSYRLRAPTAAGGRSLTTSVATFRPTRGARVRRVSWRTAFVVRNRPPVGAPAPVTLPPAQPPPSDPDPPPPPPPAQADLSIETLTATLVTVRNGGNASAGPFVLRVTRTTDNGAFPQDIPVAGLAAGSATTIQFVCPAGTTKIEAVADAQGQVVESNEGNNAATYQPPQSC